MLVTIVADVPFVITIASDPADGVILSMDKAEPAVDPNHFKSTTVEDPVIELFVIVKVCVAPDAIETLLKATEKTRPLAV